MYVVANIVPYESAEMLGASESESVAQAFMQSLADKQDIDEQHRTFVLELLGQWRENNPIPVCPHQKPPFDQSRANDKEYVKTRNAGPIREWHENLDHWTAEVSIPYTNLVSEKLEEFAAIARRQNFTPRPDYKHDYTVVFVKTI